ncbi:hypothetical protein AMECASPLE_028380 [Ameca splendens]|uniref:Uncharacterized protein n=1 Tax=Ameca splendens TaxID=208324 RepID=A0ABV0Z4A4_9TELE
MTNQLRCIYRHLPDWSADVIASQRELNSLTLMIVHTHTHKLYVNEYHALWIYLQSSQTRPASPHNLLSHICTQSTHCGRIVRNKIINTATRLAVKISRTR